MITFLKKFILYSEAKYLFRLVILSHLRDFEIHSEPLLGLRHAFENLYELWHGLLLALPFLQEVFSLESGRKRNN